MSDNILTLIDRDELMKGVTFGKAFRITRVDHGLSMKQMAAFLGWTVPQLSDMERNRAPALGRVMLEHACDHMGVNDVGRAILYRLRAGE